jgi:DNA-directed RNA polymerase subunit RPC12/RpoP
MAKRICAYCKKIVGYNEHVAQDTHTICPPCKERVLKEYREGLIKEAIAEEKDK